MFCYMYIFLNFLMLGKILNISYREFDKVLVYMYDFNLYFIKYEFNNLNF